MQTVTLIEGDGIGPEIAAATVRAIEAAGGVFAWERADAGAGAAYFCAMSWPNTSRKNRVIATLYSRSARSSEAFCGLVKACCEPE